MDIYVGVSVGMWVYVWLHVGMRLRGCVLVGEEGMSGYMCVCVEYLPVIMCLHVRAVHVRVNT